MIAIRSPAVIVVPDSFPNLETARRKRDRLQATGN